jgi:hypothetical protein
MSDEQERLKRLRDRQLGDRDPQVKQKKIQRTITHRQRQALKKRETIGEIWQMVPHKIRSPLIGFVVGVLIVLFLPSVWHSPWAVWVGVFVTLLLVVFGAIVGDALDVRDDLRDFNKH